MKRNARLIREQLEVTLRRLGPLKEVTPPVSGWIRAIRDALNMNGRQLADRLGEHRSRSNQLEQQEQTGSLTLKAMRKTAEALDCVFVYAIVPRISLEETMRNRAMEVAVKRLVRATQTMQLENQALNSDENKEVLSRMVDEMMDSPPANLWDELDKV